MMVMALQDFDLYFYFSIYRILLINLLFVFNKKAATPGPLF